MCLGIKIAGWLRFLPFDPAMAGFPVGNSCRLKNRQGRCPTTTGCCHVRKHQISAQNVVNSVVINIETRRYYVQLIDNKLHNRTAPAD